MMISSDDIKALKQLKVHAEANPFSMDDLFDMASKTKPSAGDQAEFCHYLASGDKVVLSVENQEAGTGRHLSVSVKTPGKVPNLLSVAVIMQATGFKRSPTECVKVWLETFEENHEAINVWDFI